MPVDLKDHGLDLSGVEEADYTDDSPSMEADYREEDIKNAHESVEKIHELKRVGMACMIDIATELYKFREERKYKFLGYSTFESFYQGDLGMSKSTVYRYLGIYQKFILKLNIPVKDLLDIDVKKLDKVSQLVTEKEDSIIDESNAEDWLQCAKDLSESDLIEKVNDAKGIENEKAILEERENFSRGMYKLIKVQDVSPSDLESISDTKVKFEVYKDGNGEFYARNI